MLVVPTPLDEVMSSTSAMAPRCRSSGVATVLAMTSGLAPGSCAETKMAGTSMRGSGATGSSMNAAAPHSATPAVNKSGCHRPLDEGRGNVHAGLVRQVRSPRRLRPRMRAAMRSNAR